MTNPSAIPEFLRQDRVGHASAMRDHYKPGSVVEVRGFVRFPKFRLIDAARAPQFLLFLAGKTSPRFELGLPSGSHRFGRLQAGVVGGSKRGNSNASPSSSSSIGSSPPTLVSIKLDHTWIILERVNQPMIRHRHHVISNIRRIQAEMPEAQGSCGFQMHPHPVRLSSLRATSGGMVCISST